MSFRIIIAGGRKFNNYELLKQKMDVILKNIKDDIVIVEGEAPGADLLGKRYGIERGYKIDEYPAKWEDIEGKDTKFIKINSQGYKYFVLAGNDRNKLMSENADALVAFHDGKSTGTADMISIAKKKGLLVRVIKY